MELDLSDTPEFKKEAVRLVTEQGYKVTEAARNIGIHPSVLTRWKRQLASEGTNAFPSKGRLTPKKNEVNQINKTGLRSLDATGGNPAPLFDPGPREDP